MARPDLFIRDGGRVISAADRFRGYGQRQPAQKGKMALLLLRDVVLTRGTLVTIDADLAGVLISSLRAVPSGD